MICGSARTARRILYIQCTKATEQKSSGIVADAVREWMVTAMAKIKNTMTVSLEEFGKKAGEYALDEFEYKGLTIRQWADKITSGEYQPVKHGKWELISQNKFTGTKTLRCTYCKNYFVVRDDTLNAGRGDANFCPNCGSKKTEWTVAANETDV